MKKMTTLIFLVASFATMANTITLSPGSQATINVEAPTTVTCEGSAMANSSKKSCRVIPYNQKLANGQVCDTRDNIICAEVVQYGTTIESNKFWNYNGSSAAQWCESRIGN